MGSIAKDFWVPMCELFGLSASARAAPRELLHEFRRRGGLTADNPDGWGMAWRENGAFSLVKEPLPAHLSREFGRLIETLHSSLIIAHVRKAKFPPVNTLNNTHPFQRVCCGRVWVFAHNGLVPDVVEMEQTNLSQVCHPSGETDSEYAFCHLLSHITQHLQGSAGDDRESWLSTLAKVSQLIATHGKFNFLMSDGEHLIAYGHDRLHHLEDEHCALVATEPLSASDAWIPFEEGELRVYLAGCLVGRAFTRDG